MDPVPGTIAARSRFEAMDWSLVLISQGIESTVTEVDGQWIVSVSPPQHHAASEAIQLFRSENRHWKLRRELLRPGLFFDWVAGVWVVLICAFYFLSVTRVNLRPLGVVDTRAVSHGEWWRLFTAIWLHADLAHLASNASFGFLLLGLAMARFGPGVALAAAYLAGATGNVLSWLCAIQPHLGLGASGMVMGSLGLLAAQSLRFWRQNIHVRKHFYTSLFAGTMLFLLLGVSPGTDVVAHFGGFMAGLLEGFPLTQFQRRTHQTFPNTIGALLFATLLFVPWWLALRHAS
jgi:membrane associated rhomboid family serine protease